MVRVGGQEYRGGECCSEQGEDGEQQHRCKRERDAEECLDPLLSGAGAKLCDERAVVGRSTVQPVAVS